MICLILAGGYGTRLRPLTLSVSKQSIPFCNLPILEHQIEAAVRAGIDHVILAVSDSQYELSTEIRRLKEKYKIRIDCSVETKPLGTAGPLRLAKGLICDKNDKNSDFLVLNCDVICNYPFEEIIRFHLSKRATMTISVTKISDPREFGVVIHDESFKIERFVEKPTELISNNINAGVYVLSKSVIDMIPEGDVSIERYLFPKLVVTGASYCYPLRGYWVDIGKPVDYLRGQSLYLSACTNRSSSLYVGINDHGDNSTKEVAYSVHLTEGGILIGEVLSDDISSSRRDCLDLHKRPKIGKDVCIKAPVLIHETAEIARGCVIGPNVCIGAGVKIAEGCRIMGSSIMEGVIIDAYSFVEGSIVGWNSHFRSWVRVEGLSVFGKSVSIEEAVFVRGCTVLPHKVVSTNLYESGKIII